MYKSSLIVFFTVTQFAYSALSFNFTFDSSVSATAQGVLNNVANYIENTIDSPSSASIEVDVDFGSIPGLGLALTPFGATNTTGFNAGSIAYLEAMTGSDLNTTTSDYGITFSDSVNWSFTSTVGVTEFSFFDVVLHELIHGIGFLGAIQEDGTSLFASSGFTNLFTPYDELLGDESGANIIDAAGNVDLGRWSAAVTGGTGVLPPTSVSGTDGLYFYGSNAMAVNGGQAVPLYSPTVFNDGSSIAHLDTDAFTSDNFALEHALAPGVFIGQLGALELAVLEDIGYTVIPEPSSLLLAFMGAGAFCFRRRRKQNC